MLKIYSYTDLSQVMLEKICLRNTDSDNSIRNTVEQIISNVRKDGDTSLLSYAESLDGVKLSGLSIGKAALEELAAQVNEEEATALNTAYANIKKFHENQLTKEAKVETMTGVTCWRELRAIEKVGLYIPGGSAVLPSTFLMLGIPARIAGCKEIVVCSPPQKDGGINKYIAYCAQLLNIDRVYLAGGAQAVAAMAYGTASIPRVDKIFGPGNQYVTMAKSIIQSTSLCAIDMPAGPSEVLVIAGADANPEFVAADFLAQAEHGADSQAILISTSAQMIGLSIAALEKQLPLLPRAAIAAKALERSYAVVVDNMEQAMAFSNTYAPEHLILATNEWESLIPNIINAGSVFLGNLTPESAGDYASGTNHTLPTSGYAKAYSGVSVDSFVKKITFQHITQQGVSAIGKTVETLAALEGLDAHRNAMLIRNPKNN